MIISVIGGVDVGKSSIIARILINTGSVNNREVLRVQKESAIMKKPNQWLPNLIDTNYKEQERGITIQATSESFTYKEQAYTLINNSGHESLINEMIKYSSKSDIGILVVSAKPSELNKSIKNGFEHALIIRLNGIKNLIICINKSEFINSTTNSFEMIVNTIKKSLKKLQFEKLTFCPASAKLNINISKNDSHLVNYSLLDIIENLKIPKRETRCIKPIENLVKAKLFFHNIPKIISPGFKCVLNSFDKTYNIELNSIKNDDLNYVTTSNSKNKFINCNLNI